MAALQIPSPDAAGYWHFTYRTTDETGRWYGGKRSTKKHPSLDRYKGSGNWVRSHPAKERLQREIVEFCSSSAEVYAAEAAMITTAVLMDDAFCMNQRGGGDGFTVEDRQRAHNDPEFQGRMLDGIRRRSDNLTWRENHGNAVRRVTSTAEWKASQKAGSKRRSQDPVWIADNAATAKRLASDPTWIANQGAAIQRIRDDGTWKIAHEIGIKNRAENSEWVANVAASGRKRAMDPGWQASQKLAKSNPAFRAELSAVGTDLWKDPIWRDGMLAARAAGRAKRLALGIVAPGTTAFVTLNGKRVPLKEACRQIGLPYQTAYARLQRGIPESEWLTLPTKKKTAS